MQVTLEPQTVSDMLNIIRLYDDGVISTDDLGKAYAYYQSLSPINQFGFPAQWSSRGLPPSGRYRSVPTDRYPHVCPKCAKPAYIGLSQIDCSGGCK